MLKNAPTLAIRNAHTAENEPCEVCPLSVDRSPRYDIGIWSATSKRWIDAKLTELGVYGNNSYEISIVVDARSMVSTVVAGEVKNVKPLVVVWRTFPDFYTEENTIMFDDIRRNFALNPQNGLTVRPFKRATTEGKDDAELPKLAHYLIAIKDLESFSELDHLNWESYLKRRKKSKSAEHGKQEE